MFFFLMFFLLNSFFLFSIFKLVLSRQYTSRLQPFFAERWCTFDLSGKIIEHSADFFREHPKSSEKNFWTFAEGFCENDHVERLKKQQQFSYALSSKNFLLGEFSGKNGKNYFFGLKPISCSIYFLWFQESTEKKPTKNPYQNFLKTAEILKNLPVMIWHHSKHKKIDYFNVACTDVFGNRTTEIQENIFFSSKKISIGSEKSGKTQKIRSTRILKGEKKFFEIWQQPDDQGGAWGCALDISEHEKNKEALKKHIKSLENLFSYFSTGVIIFNKSQKLHYFNAAYLKLFELDEKWLKKHPTFDEVFEELRHKRRLPEVIDFPAYKRNVLSFFEEDVALREELLHLPDERTFRFTVASYPLGGLILLFEDITERLILERKNNALLAVQNALTHHLQEGVLIVGMDHRLILMNAFCMRLWGIEKVDHKNGDSLGLSHLLDKSRYHFDFGHTWELYQSRILFGMANRLPQNGIMRRKDGLALKFQYIPLPNGDHLITYQDVTDALKSEEILNESVRLLKMNVIPKENGFLLEDATQSKNLKPFSLQATLEPVFLFLQKSAQEKKFFFIQHIAPDADLIISNTYYLSKLLYSILGHAVEKCLENDSIILSLRRKKNKARLVISCRTAFAPFLAENKISSQENFPSAPLVFPLPLIKELSVLSGCELISNTKNPKKFQISCYFSCFDERFFNPS